MASYSSGGMYALAAGGGCRTDAKGPLVFLGSVEISDPPLRVSTGLDEHPARAGPSGAAGSV